MPPLGNQIPVLFLLCSCSHGSMKGKHVNKKLIHLNLCLPIACLFGIILHMRKMSTERRAAILSALVEGNSISATCRMFSVNKVTVLRLLADAGTLAGEYHDVVVQNLETKRL